ncbi:UNVERIFIED_CONTAM: Cyclic dof factor 2 [Sesamum radiatum]|uniref:Cyclic dof factor 2 n=1 Tax=Sesamum radiatum TaxID=300843 RepID=A0AAW2P4Y5_SESRA
MSEVKDPKLKLFGQTIELPDTSAPAAESGGPVSAQTFEGAGEDSLNQDPPCSSNSMLEDSSFNRDGEDQESFKAFLQELPEILDSWRNHEECACGAGRRKNKNSISQFRHLTVPEALQTPRVDLPNGIHHPALNPNGTVLTFSSDSRLCESMASVLNIVDKTIMNNSRNGFHTPDEIGIPASRGSKEAGDDCSSRSSAAATSSKDNGKTGLPEMMPNCRPFPPQVPCFSGAPWPYPWNSVQWSSPVSPPTFGPASFPVPFYSTATPYWGCAVPGAWNVPWVIPPTHTASQSHTPPSSGPNSPTLGKHSRDDNIVGMADTKDEETRKESNSEKCLWVPKTLRIDDPGEAAKSSIWATLGIKNDRADSGGGGLFKPFQPQSKGDEKTHVSETSTVLQANPAALSRSLSFHESS